MADETKNPAAAPAANVNPVSGATTPSRAAEQTDINAKDPAPNDPAAERAAREGRAGEGNYKPAAGAAPTSKSGPARSGLVTNPAPDPDAPAEAAGEQALPQATINEMEAGKKALERNKPVVRKDVERKD